jgi:long-subunit acyl-CoA synthetase (AMP-forming)
MKLGLAIGRAARYFKNRCALVCEGQTRTYAEIETNSNRVANGLLHLGLTREDRVALVCDNSVEYIETDFALYKSGLVRVAINPMLSAGEVAHIIKDSGAKAVVVSSKLADQVLSMRKDLDQVANYICIGDPVDGTVPFVDLLVQSDDFTPPREVTEDDLLMLFYTGGTTGVPKGAMHTHNSVMHVLANLQAEFWNLRPTDLFPSGGQVHNSGPFRPEGRSGDHRTGENHHPQHGAHHPDSFVQLPGRREA